ncbi:MAG: DinB family protein [Acidobacteriota bacterium]
MTTRIDRQIRSLDTRRNALLDELAPLDPAVLGRSPAPGKWSILEIVEHLVLSEREVCRFPETAERRDRPRRLKHRFAYFVVFLVLRFRIRVKAPSPKMLPQGEWSLADSRREWDENLNQLRAYASGLDRKALDRAVFKHPAAGPITLSQALTLGLLHVEDHARQIGRLKAKGEFPSAG